jgi:alanine racemase
MNIESSTANLRAWVEVDLGALVRNARSLIAHARVPLLPMVKADAYGLGAVEVTRALAAVEPWGFGVATVPEGAELRTAGHAGRIVVFTPLLQTEFESARRALLTPTLGDPSAIRAWQQKGGAWQLAVDTGMQRAGVPWDRVADVAELVNAGPPEGAFTHYHSPERDDGSMAEQDHRFSAALDALPVRPALLHTDNSAAIVRRDVQPHHLVRPGVFLYGVGSGPDRLAPEPVVHFRARILELRTVPAGESASYGATWRAATPRVVATVAAGYADGVRRHLSNTGRGLLHGREVPIVGTVTMDMTLLDVTGVPCECGDVVTLVGRDGDRVLTLEDVAHDGGLSPYELLTGLRQRVPRVYLPATGA